MIALNLRPSNRAVCLIAGLERAVGRWEHSSDLSEDSMKLLELKTLLNGAKAAHWLDTTSQTTELETELLASKEGGSSADNDDRFSAYISAFRPLPKIVLGEMANLFAKAVDSPAQDELGSRALITNGLEADNLRKQHQHFRSPEPYIKGDNRVFPTIAPYMIPSRLNELIAWTNKNLSDELEHPLLTIAAFHLVFLQISPFPTANHRIAIMLTWGMLAAHGYGFVRLNHYSPIWKNRAAEYFQALHQAEKTSFESWNTLNIWLEFFLETLHESVSKLLEESQTIQRTKRLTEVQQQLLASIRHHGFARRELLSKETGIKLSTVKYNLSVLQSRGLIQLIGAGRTAGYQVAK